MSDDGFNPYREWLGLDPSVTQPGYYELLGLDPAEQSTQRILEAGNRVIARVRNCRPGSRGAQWAKVLAEVTAAASCLSDPIRRAEYDRQLGRGEAGRGYNRPAPRGRLVPPSGGSSAPNALPLQGAASAALPMQAPTGYPQGPAGTAAYLDPMAPVVPAGPAAATAGYAQASPYAGAPMPPAASMPSYPAAVSRGGVPGGTPAISVPVGVPLRPVAVAPASVPKERSASAKVRQRSRTSSLTVIAISAGVGMVLLAGAIVLIILSRKTEERNRRPQGPFIHSRPVVTVPSPPAETFHRPSPSPRHVQPVERKSRLPVLRSEREYRAPVDEGTKPLGPGGPLSAGDTPPDADSPPSSAEQMPQPVDVPAAPTFSPPTNRPLLDSPPVVGPEAKSPTDNTLTLPAFPAAPTLPSAPPAPPPLSKETTPGESPSAPSSGAMPDAAAAKPPLPESKPAPSGTQPESPKPAEATAVKPEEVATLAKTLKAAHAAILNGRYEAAEAELNKVEPLPKRPEDHAKYERLTLVAGYAKNFQAALKKAVAGLHPGDDIQVGNSTVVGFVSAAKDSITLRVTGTNRTYALESLPVGLAVAIAERWLNKNDPATLAMKGAYVASLKDLDEERKAKAREWLEEASKKGIEGELHKVLDDTYDLEKDRN